MIKNLPAMHKTQVQVRKNPWRRNGYPLQYSCLENSMYRGAQWATVHGIARSDQSHLTSIHSVCSPVWRKEGQPKV